MMNSIGRRHYSKTSGQAGFTIVELMIATSVFSMVLLVVIYGVLSFSHAYFGGLNSSATQDTARTVINTVTQSIEFSGNSIAPTTQVGNPKLNQYYFCAGNATYFFDEGALYDGKPASLGDPGLYVEPGSCISNPNKINFKVTGGKELLGANMRITYLRVKSATSDKRLWTVETGIAFGESDLLCNVSLNGKNGGCLPKDKLNGQGQPIVGKNLEDVECHLVTGSQFCAHAALSTTVALRVAGIN